MPKRSDYISWDEYFMGIAMLSGLQEQGSEHPGGRLHRKQEQKQDNVRRLYRFPSGCDDDEFPWEREGSAFNTKYAYVCHAELNAILNASGDLRGCKVYVALFPCNECAKAIIQSGIKEVIYISDKYRNTDSVRASKRMFDAAGVKYTKLEMKRDKLVIDFSENSI